MASKIYEVCINQTGQQLAVTENPAYALYLTDYYASPEFQSAVAKNLQAEAMRERPNQELIERLSDFLRLGKDSDGQIPTYSQMYDTARYFQKSEAANV